RGERDPADDVPLRVVADAEGRGATAALDPLEASRAREHAGAVERRAVELTRRARVRGRRLSERRSRQEEQARSDEEGGVLPEGHEGSGRAGVRLRRSCGRTSPGAGRDRTKGSSTSTPPGDPRRT